MIRTITPIFSIIVAIIIFFVYSKPMFAEIKQVQGQVIQYEEAAAKATELNAELSNKLTQKRSYDAESLERLEALVPRSVDEIKILNDLSEVARHYRLLFGNIKVVTEEEESVTVEDQESKVVTYDDLVTTDIEFSVIGTYEQFKSFLADVEQSLVMLDVTKIEFQAGEGNLQQYDMSVRASSLPPIE